MVCYRFLRFSINSLIPTNPGHLAPSIDSNHGHRSKATRMMLSFKHHANHEQMAVWLQISNLAHIYFCWRHGRWPEMFRRMCFHLFMSKEHPPFVLRYPDCRKVKRMSGNVQARDSYVHLALYLKSCDDCQL